jgi:hypothetical protein
LVLTFVYLLVIGVESIIALDHTPWQTTLGTTPLDEGSAGPRDYLETLNTHKAHISMPSVGFELAVPGNDDDRPTP